MKHILYRIALGALVLWLLYLTESIHELKSIARHVEDHIGGLKKW
jgi:hypothetical protein